MKYEKLRPVILGLIGQHLSYFDVLYSLLGLDLTGLGVGGGGKGVSFLPQSVLSHHQCPCGVHKLCQYLYWPQAGLHHTYKHDSIIIIIIIIINGDSHHYYS